MHSKSKLELIFNEEGDADFELRISRYICRWKRSNRHLTYMICQCNLRQALMGNLLILRFVRGKSMTKADIAERVANENGFTKLESMDLVESVLSIIKDTLANGETLKVSGFGNFVVKEKKDRRGRNPQTGGEITIDARRVLTFKPSALLKDAMNKS